MVCKSLNASQPVLSFFGFVVAVGIFFVFVCGFFVGGCCLVGFLLCFFCFFLGGGGRVLNIDQTK